MLKNVVAKGGNSNLRQVYKETKKEVKRQTILWEKSRWEVIALTTDSLP